LQQLGDVRKTRMNTDDFQYRVFAATISRNAIVPKLHGARNKLGESAAETFFRSQDNFRR